MIKVNIGDGSGGGSSVKVSPQGEFFTRQLKFGEGQFQALDTINTAFNFFKPRAGERFIITIALINTNKDIGVDGAIFDLYEADSETSTTIDKQLAKINILKNDVISIPGIFIAVSEGKFLNGKTDDATVNVTIGGYYIDI